MLSSTGFGKTIDSRLFVGFFFARVVGVCFPPNFKTTTIFNKKSMARAKIITAFLREQMMGSSPHPKS
jgi:hypothetical protein